MNIFNQEENLKLQQRLEKASPDCKALWGKMNASQMVLHCQKPLDIAEGKIIMRRGLIGLLFGKMAKNSFMNDDFKKNLPTAKQFKVTNDPDFETEKGILLNTIRKFGMMGPKVIVNKKHPFFGSLTEEEWGILQYKHLDHHLKQFGI